MMNTQKMDKFIRLSSMQSGNFNAINNMITFNLPQDGSYDFSSSYVEINTQITQATQDATDAGGDADFRPVYNPQMKWYDSAECVNNSKIIRRGQLRSNKQGLVEDILRQDILQPNLVNYTHSTEELSSLSYKSIVQHRNWTGTRSSMWREFNQTGTTMSRVVNAPINIPLSQIINLGSAREVPLDKMGGGQLMIDANFTIGATGWSSTSEIAMPAGDGATDAVNNIVSSAADTEVGMYDDSEPATMRGLVLTRKYPDMEAFPFWVGANIVVAATGGTGALNAGPAANAVITRIDVSTDDGTIELFTDQSVATLADAATLEGLTVVLKAPDEEGEIIFVSAQLVLKKLATPSPAESSLTYTTWETEEFSQATSAQLNATFRLPANCINAIVMLPTTTGVSQLLELETYRLSIDNVPIVNRAIDVTAGIRNCLHYDLIMRSFEIGQLRLHNMSEIQRNVGTTLAIQTRGQNTASRAEDIIIIGVPTVETPQSKLLQVNLTASAGLVNLVVFKQVVRTVAL